MKTITTGTLIDRVVQLDQQVDLPNHSRVNVSIEPMQRDSEKPAAALARFLKRAEARGFDSGGHRFTRDELHERD
ncbi:MAG: hypothetical protein K8T91_16020 [Planctomycetes bacterium]|nr:hypothetical protein [Planctomycetota bacterium]